eukprot:1477114-Rhodomonas_salina.1
MCDLRGSACRVRERPRSRGSGGLLLLAGPGLLQQRDAAFGCAAGLRCFHRRRRRVDCWRSSGGPCAWCRFVPVEP